jgi:hypothetical protein
MKPEDLFVKNLEFFLDQKFDEYGRSRILNYLKEYKDTIPPIYINKTIIKKVVSPKKPMKEEEDGMCAYENMNQVAEEICQLFQIKIGQLLGRDYGKKSVIVEARRQFCEIMFNRYRYHNYILADFLGVHYSTVSFYIYGKSYNIDGRKHDYRRKRAV